MVLFINPDKGYKIASITWGGFMGVVSGMNEKGLTVTLNAAKSGLPSSAKTPISIVARQILQYAKNIDEAYSIAQKFETFVSESIMIGSAEDRKSAIIEKSVDSITLYMSDSNSIVCSNHYQSNKFKTDKDNLSNIASSASNYRQNRTTELLNIAKKLDYQKVANILRDCKGIDNTEIGLGNEKALNQLQGYHSVIFMPEKRLMWVSTSPYQLGAYVAYDLNAIFNAPKPKNKSIGTDSILIHKDTFVNSLEFKNYIKFRKLKKEITQITQSGINYDKEGEQKAEEIIELNPNYYHAHELAGNFYKAKKLYKKAIVAYKEALQREIATKTEQNIIQSNLEECKAENRKLHAN